MKSFIKLAEGEIIFCEVKNQKHLWNIYFVY